MAQHAQINIIYDGTALSEHEMDANDLAPALLAFSELIETTNEIINANHSKISVKIKGSFQSGSFDVGLILHQSTNNLFDFMTSKYVEAPINLITLIGLAGGGLIGLIKNLKNKKPEKVIKKGDNVEIIVENETYLTDMKVFALFSNIKIRQSLEKVLSPLKKEGIDTFKTKSDVNSITITKDEISFFDAPVEQDILLEDNLFETNLQLVNVSFQEANKWKFSDGNSTFFASILDEDFMKLVLAGKSNFAKDDILKVSLKRKQFEREQKIHTIYEIMKVLDHRRPSNQLSIFIQQDDNDFQK
jgi:hypothetical protein